jgi:enoyl-CoA hydratase/carnithine racemase
VSEPRVGIDVAAGVAGVRLTRPDKHNALDLAMFEAIRAAQRDLDEVADLRAVVLRGEGPSFCSGLDLAAVATGGMDVETLTSRADGELANLAQSVSFGWRQLPVPVIAALHGVCFGGGLQIALGADVRIAGPDARLSVMEVALGLIPDMAITTALPRLLREDVARELTYSGRIVDAEEALALGLVTRVAEDPAAAAAELAAEIAARSPDAVRSAKRLLDRAWDAPPRESLRIETEHVRLLLGSPNQIEAATAAIGKREPRFAPADPERIPPGESD